MIAVRGHFDGKAIVPDEPVDLPQGRSLIVHIEVEPVDEQAAERVSALEWIADNAVDSPAIPADGATQHDHYLYGTAKKP